MVIRPPDHFRCDVGNDTPVNFDKESCGIDGTRFHPAEPRSLRALFTWYW